MKKLIFHLNFSLWENFKVKNCLNMIQNAGLMLQPFFDGIHLPLLEKHGLWIPLVIFDYELTGEIGMFHRLFRCQPFLMIIT
jgi:hypothetical protein